MSWRLALNVQLFYRLLSFRHIIRPRYCFDVFIVKQVIIVLSKNRVRCIHVSALYNIISLFVMSAVFSSGVCVFTPPLPWDGGTA